MTLISAISNINIYQNKTAKNNAVKSPAFRSAMPIDKVVKAGATGMPAIAALPLLRLIDYYDPEDIKEARDNYHVFRNAGEDDFEYRRRARATHEAFERNKRVNEEANDSPWWWPF